MSDMRNDGFPSKKSKGLGLKVFVALAFVSVVVAAIVVVPKTTFFQGNLFGGDSAYEVLRTVDTEAPVINNELLDTNTVAKDEEIVSKDDLEVMIDSEEELNPIDAPIDTVAKDEEIVSKDDLAVMIDSKEELNPIDAPIDTVAIDIDVYSLKISVSTAVEIDAALVELDKLEKVAIDRKDAKLLEMIDIDRVALESIELDKVN